MTRTANYLMRGRGAVPAAAGSKTSSENRPARRSRRRVGRRRLVLAACLLAALLVPAVAEATSGALDPSFGAGGTTS